MLRAVSTRHTSDLGRDLLIVITEVRWKYELRSTATKGRLRPSSRGSSESGIVGREADPDDDPESCRFDVDEGMAGTNESGSGGTFFPGSLCAVRRSGKLFLRFILPADCGLRKTLACDVVRVCIASGSRNPFGCPLAKVGEPSAVFRPDIESMLRRTWLSLEVWPLKSDPRGESSAEEIELIESIENDLA